MSAIGLGEAHVCGRGEVETAEVGAPPQGAEGLGAQRRRYLSDRERPFLLKQQWRGVPLSISTFFLLRSLTGYIRKKMGLR